MHQRTVERSVSRRWGKFALGILAATLLPWLTGCSGPKGASGLATESTRDVELSRIAGLSREVYEEQGKRVQIEDPVIFLPASNFYLFSVHVPPESGADSEGEDYEFAGDAETLNQFVREIVFVGENSADWRGMGLAAVRGGVDDVAGAVKGLVDLVFHPINTGVAIRDGGAAAISYLRNLGRGEGDLKEDAERFLSAYLEDVREGEASRAGFSYPELKTEKARTAFTRLADAKIAGMAATELATALATWSKVGRMGTAGDALAKIARSEKLVRESEQAVAGARAARLESVFANAAIAARGASRAAAAAAVEQRLQSLTALGPLLQPQRILTLQGELAMNSRLHKVMYWMHKAEQEGRNVEETLKRAIKLAGADRPVSGLLLDARLDRPQLIHNYRTLENVGVFKNPNNLNLMRAGRSPAIADGPFEGKLHVDHIIPRRDAPELANVWGNLRYFPEKLNLERGPKPGRAFMDQSMAKRLEEYRDAGLLSQRRVNEILRSTLMPPAR